MLLVGDSAWETLDLSTAGNPPHPRLGIRRSDGTRIILDTISSFYNNLLLAGKGYDFLIVLSGRPQFGDSTQDQEIICYRWSLDARVPDVRKQVLRLDHPAVFGGFLSSQVLGEPRAYIAFGQDSLEEFAVRNDTLSFLGYRVLPASDSGSPLDKSFRNGGLSIDPSGCIHSLDLEGAWTGMRPATDSGSIPVLIHASTCQAAADTVALPHPASGEFQAHASGLRFAPDGSPLLSVVMQKPAIADDGRLQQSIPPSWLYFARRGAGNRWTWEKLAEF
jgi:hypothetical protein